MALLQAELSGMEQAEWLASMQLDPPEEDRADIRHAQLSALLVERLTRAPADEAEFLEALPWRARSEAAPPPPPAQPAPSLRRKIDAVMTMLGGRR